MLTSEALIQEANERGMPGVKMRGVLREYLQVLLMTGLYAQRGASRLQFTGGTFLRLVENLKRFSEDLDFNSWNLSRDAFETTAKTAVKGMEKHGITGGIEFEHRGRLSTARISFPDVESAYGIRSGYSRKGGMMIKFETNRPAWKKEADVKIISGFGEMIPVPCTPIPVLMADKIDAIISKNKGRHIYDLITLLGRKTRVDLAVWKKIGGKGAPIESLVKRVSGLKKAELKKMAESLRPFLFDEREARLVADADTIIPELVRQMGNTTFRGKGPQPGVDIDDSASLLDKMENRVSFRR